MERNIWVKTALKYLLACVGIVVLVVLSHVIADMPITYTVACTVLMVAYLIVSLVNLWQAYRKGQTVVYYGICTDAVPAKNVVYRKFAAAPVTYRFVVTRSDTRAGESIYLRGKMHQYLIGEEYCMLFRLATSDVSTIPPTELSAERLIGTDPAYGFDSLSQDDAGPADNEDAADEQPGKTVVFRPKDGGK